MIFRNPCKKCLVRACCSNHNICKEKMKFNKFSDTIVPIGSFMFSFIITMSLLIFLIYKIDSTNILIISLILFWLISLIIIKIYLDIGQISISDVKDLLALLVLSPFMVITLPLMDLYDKANKI